MSKKTLDTKWILPRFRYEPHLYDKSFTDVTPKKSPFGYLPNEILEKIVRELSVIEQAAFLKADANVIRVLICEHGPITCFCIDSKMHSEDQCTALYMKDLETNTCLHLVHQEMHLNQNVAYSYVMYMAMHFKRNIGSYICFTPGYITVSNQERALWERNKPPESSGPYSPVQF